jgi:thioredoxin reductase/bacterioferritin-associated ferredoxin
MQDIVDISIVGAGPAGATAALVVGQAECRSLLIDEQGQAGGQVWRAKDRSILSAPATPESRSGDNLRERLAASGVRQMTDTRVWQIERQGEHWVIHTLRNGAAGRLHSRAVILATGAREEAQPVQGWTTPGVIGLAGATALFKQSIRLPGRASVVAGTGPLVFFVASEIRRLGGTVAAAVTPNTRADWLARLPSMVARPDLLWRGGRWVADLMLAGVPIYWGHAVKTVFGDDRVTGVTLCRLAADGTPLPGDIGIVADSVCLGGGLAPSTEAAQMAGVAVRYRPELGGWVSEAELDGSTAREGLFLAGDGCGIRGAVAAELHGQIVARTALRHIGQASASDPALERAYRRASRFGEAMTALSALRADTIGLATPDTVVCRCESLTRRAIEAEIESGAVSSNAVKSGQRAGMGPCGGKYCQSSVARLIALHENRALSEIAPPTPRPPIRPVPVSALAGDFDYGDLPMPKPAPL